MLRFHGSRAKKDFELIGYNSRLDALQAAMLRIFLPHLDGWNAARREAAARYAELGLGEVAELPADEPGHVYHMYCVRSFERDRLAAALAEAEIGFASYYQPPLHLQPALPLPRLLRGRLPGDGEGRRVRTSACRCGPGSREEQQAEVVGVLRRASSLVQDVISFPVNRHRLWQVVARRRADRGRLVARVLPLLRPDGPALLPQLPLVAGLRAS